MEFTRLLSESNKSYRLKIKINFSLILKTELHTDNKKKIEALNKASSF